MDDLASMITQFLNSEEGMNQLNSVASALGLDMSSAGQTADQGGSTQPGGPQVSQNATSQQSGFQGVDAKTMTLLQRVLSAYNTPDQNAQLLLALKPHFSPQRAKKVDDAIRILSLIKLLPIIKDSGVLGGDR